MFKCVTGGSYAVCACVGKVKLVVMSNPHFSESRPIVEVVTWQTVLL